MKLRTVFAATMLLLFAAASESIAQERPKSGSFLVTAGLGIAFPSNLLGKAEAAVHAGDLVIGLRVAHTQELDLFASRHPFESTTDAAILIGGMIFSDGPTFARFGIGPALTNTRLRGPQLGSEGLWIRHSFYVERSFTVAGLAATVQFHVAPAGGTGISIEYVLNANRHRSFHGIIISSDIGGAL